MLFFAWANAIAELIGFLLFTAHYKVWFIVYPYTFVEFTLLSLFYIRFLQPHTNTFIFKLIMPLFFIFCLVLSSITGPKRGDDYNMILECFIFTGYCLYLFYFLIKKTVFEDLLREPVFWINTGVLFYFTGNLIIFLSNAYHTWFINPFDKAGGPSEANWMIWSITHTFFNVSMSILFSIGLWKARTK